MSVIREAARKKDVYHARDDLFNNATLRVFTLSQNRVQSH